MKVGIIGYNGFVGSALFEVFSEDRRYDTIGIGHEDQGGLADSDFDILINANGSSSKRVADEDPLRDFEMNVWNTLRFLQTFRTKHYVHISTVEVYTDKYSKDATSEDREIDISRLTNYGFSKYLGELIAKKYSSSWMILRLAGMIGKNMKKGPAYDILNLSRLFISDKSKLHFINTMDVARITKILTERGKFNQIYNLVGKGNIELSEFARIAGVTLSEVGEKEYTFDVSVDKIGKEVGVPLTVDAVKDFVKSRRKGDYS